MLGNRCSWSGIRIILLLLFIKLFSFLMLLGDDVSLKSVFSGKGFVAWSALEITILLDSSLGRSNDLLLLFNNLFLFHFELFRSSRYKIKHSSLNVVHVQFTLVVDLVFLVVCELEETLCAEVVACCFDDLETSIC